MAWAVYDCGSSAFALSVLAVLFPVVLGSYWSVGDDGAAVTARLGWINFAASLAVFIIAPVLGAISDSGGYRKRFLFLFVILGAGATAALSFVGEGGWPAALWLFLVASIGFYGGTVFYDSLIIDVTGPRHYSALSATGFAIGYFGSAVLLSVHVWMLNAPATFGLDGTEAVMQIVFQSAGAWWFVFVLPLMFIVREQHLHKPAANSVVRDAYQSLRKTFQEIRRYRDAMQFLLAYFFYIGGVFTTIVMAINFGQRLGFETADLVKAILVTNFAGFPATLLYGWFGHRLGPKRTLIFGLIVYVGVICWAMVLDTVTEFYLMAIAIGSVQGGVQGMSRSLYAGLIPADRSGEFFGFYNTLTKLAHALGPGLVAVGAMLSPNPKFILIPLLPLFICGGYLLFRVNEPGKLRGQGA